MLELLLVYTVVVSIAGSAFLIWVYFKTRKLAVLAYLVYRVLGGFVSNQVRPQLLARIQNDGLLWLGQTEGIRITHLLYLERAIFGTLEAVLLIWLVLSLLRRSS